MSSIIENTYDQGGTHGAAWETFAPDLAQWAMSHLFVRTDTFPQWNKQAQTWKRRFAELWEGILIQHFKGWETLGSYTTDPAGNDCVYLGVDIDRHGDEDLERNVAVARTAYDALKALGAHPLLEDSNGRGGFHLWLLFCNRIPAKVARAFGQWLLRDCHDLKIEVFPKQDDVHIGNQLRLPGKHHKLNHWSRFWTGDRWVEGEEACRMLLTWKPTDPAVIPDEAALYMPKEPPKPQKPQVCIDECAEDWYKSYDGNLRTLDIAKLCEDRTTGKWSKNAAEIHCPWADAHTSGSDIAYIWPSSGETFPGFYCHHTHCQERTLRDVLALYDRETVDACCAKRFSAVVYDPADLDGIINPVDSTPASDQEPTTTQATQSEKPERKRKAHRITDLAKIPPPRWHITTIFPQESLVVLWGQAGAGKSFLALDWSLCTATGKPWLDQYKVHSGSVVYIAAEGRAGIQKRCMRWLEHHKQPIPDNLWIIPEAFSLIENKELAELVEIIEETGDRPSLVVIDTLNRNLGGKESDEDDMGRFIRAADALKKHFLTTVLIVHHTGWNSERERGHSSLRQAADTMIAAIKPGGIDAPLTEGIEVHCKKQKDFEPFDPFAVECLKAGQGDESSIVLTSGVNIEQRSAAKRQSAEDIKMCEVIKHLSETPQDAKSSEELQAITGQKRTVLNNWISRALTAQCIVRVGQGTKGSPFGYYLGKQGAELVRKYGGMMLVGQAP